MTKQKSKKLNYDLAFFACIILEIILISLLMPLFTITVIADVLGTPNATVQTSLTVGNTYPQILNVSINNDNTTVILNANTTSRVYCVAVIRDYNNQTDLDSVKGEFFHNTTSNYSADGQSGDDNNWHYTNDSCNITFNTSGYKGYSDNEFLALGNCSFDVQYYADDGGWNCTMYVNDSMNWNDTESDTISVAQLLAILLPSTIDYGTVNATEVSNENATNVTNVGNVPLNLSLEGYALAQGDGQAMNCTKGLSKNISIAYEKYNLTNSNGLDRTNLTQFETNYTNLTSSPVVKIFDLDYRKNDTVFMADAWNTTYWRIYVPLGVAGTCRGNIVFGATSAAGS